MIVFKCLSIVTKCNRAGTRWFTATYRGRKVSRSKIIILTRIFLQRCVFLETKREKRGWGFLNQKFKASFVVEPERTTRKRPEFFAYLPYIGTLTVFRSFDSDCVSPK